MHVYMHCNQVLVPALLRAREERGGGILYCTVLGIQSNTLIFELLTQQKPPGCNVRLMLIAQPIILVAQMHIILLLLLYWV